MAERVFHALDPEMRVGARKEGALVPRETTSASRRKSPRHFDRCAASLNFLEGCAVSPRWFTDSSRNPGTCARIRDTRKTTPGLRLLEKYAVKTGGGTNHRIGLYDAILLKENHIALAGGVKSALDQANAYAALHAKPSALTAYEEAVPARPRTPSCRSRSKCATKVNCAKRWRPAQSPCCSTICRLPKRNNALPLRGVFSRSVSWKSPAGSRLKMFAPTRKPMRTFSRRARFHVRARGQPELACGLHRGQVSYRYMMASTSLPGATDKRLASLVTLFANNATISISGARIAREIGVSRSTVWRWIEQLRDLGVGVKGRPHTGYFLERVPDILTPELLRLS